MVSKGLLFSGSDWAVTGEARSFANLLEGQSVSGNASERIGQEASDHAHVLAEGKRKFLAVN